MIHLFPGWFIYPLSRQEGQLLSSHKLRHLNRGTSGLRYASHSNRPHENKTQHQHHKQRTNQATNHLHQHHNTHKERPWAHLLAAPNEPRHYPVRCQHDSPPLQSDKRTRKQTQRKDCLGYNASGTPGHTHNIRRNIARDRGRASN